MNDQAIPIITGYYAPPVIGQSCHLPLCGVLTFCQPDTGHLAMFSVLSSLVLALSVI